MTTEPTVGAPAPAPSPAVPPSSHQGLLITLGVVVLIAVAVLYLWMQEGQRILPGSVAFALYENEAYHWYELRGTDIVATAAPAEAHPGATVFPDGHTLSITARGLEWSDATKKTSYVLVARPGLTPESSTLSSDGSTAVLYNEVTNALDVFTLAYQGAYVSYAGSIAVPAAPSYLAAAGVAAPATVVVRSGNPESFALYSIGSSIENRGTATLKLTTPQ